MDSLVRSVESATAVGTDDDACCVWRKMGEGETQRLRETETERGRELDSATIRASHHSPAQLPIMHVLSVLGQTVMLELAI